MGKAQTVTINGKQYDALTGMPVSVKLAATKTSLPSSHIHSTAQKSSTLNRKVVGKHQPAMPVHSTIVHPQIVKHPQVSKFAKPATRPVSASKQMMDIAPVRHPLVEKVQQTQKARKQAAAPIAHVPATTQKEQAIVKALNNSKKQSVKKQSVKKRFPRIFSVASASLAVLLLAGYLTYINMPTLSIKVAAVRSGIDASYPGYRPSGYSLDGPIAYNDGSVSMRFAANAGPQNFVVGEQASSWDSSAVLENYVTPKTGDNYVTYSDGGLTIYTFNGDAAWVNDGILYTISGDAPLSNDQVRRIATSL